MRTQLFALLFVAACGGSEPAPVEADAPAADAPAAEAKAERVPDGAKVFFVELADGAKLKSPFHVKMGVEGMEVEAAGTINVNMRRHHILIGHPAGIVGGEAVPKDDTHIHYGDGRTETDLELAPGEYTLTLQFADGSHLSYGPKMSSTVKVTVE